MGELADTVLAGKGEVIGVMPRDLVNREVAHRGLSELLIVSSMHERKALMSKMADAFVSLPGGLGTLDETFEILTWAQLGFHNKPCGLLNTKGYYNKLLEFIHDSSQSGFISPAHESLIIKETDPGEILEKLLALGRQNKS